MSLDVVAGALASGVMVSTFLRIEMVWAWYVVLPLAVWLIYTLDHLLDARRLGDAAHTLRHRFHHRHFKLIAVIWCVLLVGCLGLALGELGMTGIWFGLAMGGLVLLHLLLVRVVGDKTSPWLIKEMGVALVYSLGIWGLPILEAGVWNEPWLWISFGQFLLLALINLIEFSVFELEIDTLDGHTSFVRAIGVRKSVRFVSLLMVLVLLLGAVMIWQMPIDPIYRLEAVFGSMLLLLSALVLFQDWFGRHERYRAYGDGAFLLPILYWIFS